MKLGIVGLPNVGKSTLFNAITSTKNAEAANYPFCTIEPNSGIVAVPDKRLDKLAEIWQTNKKTPAIVEFVDIAGLVKGASQGAGLGNKFLGHIRECDAIVHVVRCFDDDNIIHVVEDVTKAEAVDPIADIDAIDYELILSDLEVVQNRAGRMAKAAKSGNNKGAAAEAAWLQKLADHLSAGKPARSFDFDEGDAEQQAVLHEMGLLSSKPVLYACNVGEDDLMEGIENNRYVPLVAARAAEVEYAALDDLFRAAEARGEQPFLVLCDGVEDPHNLGAIVRSAYLCGAHGVVIPKRGGVGVTGTVMKASAGAAARLPIARVSNLAQAIRTIKEHNIFVYCADLGGAPLAKTDLSGPVALFLGSEGGGPGALTRKLCDAAVTLEMAPGQATGVDSYNVSVAAGILCYDVMRRRLAKK